MEERFGIDFDRYFAAEVRELSAPDGPVANGFLEMTGSAVSLKPLGQLFVRNVAMVFDRYLREKRRRKPVFSRTI